MGYDTMTATAKSLIVTVGFKILGAIALFIIGRWLIQRIRAGLHRIHRIRAGEGDGACGAHRKERDMTMTIAFQNGPWR